MQAEPRAAFRPLSTFLRPVRRRSDGPAQQPAMAHDTVLHQKSEDGAVPSVEVLYQQLAQDFRRMEQDEHGEPHNSARVARRKGTTSSVYPRPRDASILRSGFIADVLSDRGEVVGQGQLELVVPKALLCRQCLSRLRQQLGERWEGREKLLNFATPTTPRSSTSNPSLEQNRFGSPGDDVYLDNWRSPSRLEEKVQELGTALKKDVAHLVVRSITLKRMRSTC